MYTDRISGDEMVSDSFPIEEVDGVLLKVKCSMMKVGGVTVNIGANASAEEAEETYDDGEERVNDVVYTSGLKVFDTLDKKTWAGHIKGYLKKIKERLEKEEPERVKEFETKINAFVSKVYKNFDDYQFYMGAKEDPDAMLPIMEYAENGIDSWLYFFKDGLQVEKY